MLDGPGGTGKSFVFEALLAWTRGRGEIALACAWSGLAATLLTGGRTCHSTFGLPVPLPPVDVPRAVRDGPAFDGLAFVAGIGSGAAGGRSASAISAAQSAMEPPSGAPDSGACGASPKPSGPRSRIVSGVRGRTEERGREGRDMDQK
jgi:hypothetical protein